MIYLVSPASKQKPVKLFSVIRSLLRGNLVYKVENSEFEK